MNGRLRRLGAVLASALLISGGFAVTAPPASAAGVWNCGDPGNPARDDEIMCFTTAITS